MGGQCTVEFQLADSEKPFALCRRRERFRALLDEAQLAEVRRLQNRVIAKWVRPPEDYFICEMGPKIVASYLRRFEPVVVDDAMLLDPWLRFMDAGDVRDWAQFLVAALPGMLTTFHPGIIAPDGLER